MSQSIGAYLLERLGAWGVDRIFAYPGDGINGILGGVGQGRLRSPVHPGPPRGDGGVRGGGLRQVLRARSGCAWPRRGRGPSISSTASMTPSWTMCRCWPSSGRPTAPAMGGSYQQEVDLASLFKDVCHQYVETLNVPQQLPNLIDRAIRTALATHSPTCIIVPYDVQELEYEPPGARLQDGPLQPRDQLAPRRRPRTTASARRRRSSMPGRRWRSWSAKEHAGPAQEITQVAEILGAGVAKALLGKDVLSDELAWVTGSLGLLGTTPKLRADDGLRHPAHRGLQLPLHPVHAAARRGPGHPDRHRRRLHRHALPLRAESGRRRRERPAGASAVCSNARSDRSWRKTVEKNVAGWWDTVERQAMTDSDREGFVNPQRLVWELSARLPANAIVAVRFRVGRQLVRPAPEIHGAEQRGSLSGTLATMGPGVPYVIGAKFAHPDRPAIALVGDGAMQMNGLAELITIKRYWQEWSDPRLIVAVLHNNDLNQVTWEMRAQVGVPKFAASQDLPDVSYAGFAASLGLEAIEVHACRRDRPGLGEGAVRRTARRCWTSTPTPMSRPSPRTPPSSRCATWPRR